MSDYLLGCDVIGAPLAKASARVASALDEVRSPTKVILSPKGLASTVYEGNIIKVDVSGGTYWYSSIGHSYMYDWPKRVTVYFSNGSQKSLDGLQSVSIFGGSLAKAGSWSAQRGMPSILGAASAGTIYTDYETVLAVQTALARKGFDPGAFDGVYGPKTAAAVKKMQAVLGAAQTGQIDYGVLMALGVTAPAEPSRPLISPAPPSDGRPAKGWSQSQPEAMGPAVTPSAPAESGMPAWKIALIIALGLGAAGATVAGISIALRRHA